MTEEIRKLLQSPGRIIGAKQTIIAVENGQIGRIILAADADEPFKQRIIGIAVKHGVPITGVPARAMLGRECGIDVGAAVVGIRKFK